MFSITNVISWIIFGLIIGAIARYLMPGQQPLGWVKTIGLGVIGSFVGGSIGSLLSRGSDTLIQPGGWIMSIVGAVLLLFVYAKVSK